MKSERIRLGIITGSDHASPDRKRPETLTFSAICGLTPDHVFQAHGYGIRRPRPCTGLHLRSGGPDRICLQEALSATLLRSGVFTDARSIVEHVYTGDLSNTCPLAADRNGAIDGRMAVPDGTRSGTGWRSAVSLDVGARPALGDVVVPPEMHGDSRIHIPGQGRCYCSGCAKGTTQNDRTDHHHHH